MRVISYMLCLHKCSRVKHLMDNDFANLFTMEFKFVIDKWERKKIKNSTQWSIITQEKNVVPIPNFMDTRRRLLKKTKGYRRTSFYRDILPMLAVTEPSRRCHYICNLLTGKWRRTKSRPKTHYLSLCHRLRKFDKECLQRRQQIKESFANVFPKELSSIVCLYS